MPSQHDSDKLLEALFNYQAATGKRPSVVDAQLRYLPEWERSRVLSAAEDLLEAGDILNPIGPALNVDISSTARERMTERKSGRSSGDVVNYNIGALHNSPLQHLSAGAYGVQNTSYQITNGDLQAIVDGYRRNVDELGLDPALRRRADKAVSTIEGQLVDDDPDEGVIKAAGKSLKTIVEGAIGGAIGNVVANPGAWALLLSLF